MEKRRKINKLKVGIVIFLIVFVFTIAVFGRYIYNSVREAYLTSKQFYFTSDILTVNGANYQYSNWGGAGTYVIEFDLYSYNNKLSKLDYDLDYTVSCETEDSDKITCTVNSNDEDATSSVNDTIYHDTNTSRVSIFVTPKSPINTGESVKVKVTARTEVPFVKEISCEFTLKVELQGENTYSIEDVANREYAMLRLINASDTLVPVTLVFDPTKLRLDLNDEIYQNYVSVEKSDDGYVKKIVFNMTKESSKYIKFYKVNKSLDYTYPQGDSECAIDVTI